MKKTPENPTEESAVKVVESLFEAIDRTIAAAEDAKQLRDRLNRLTVVFAQSHNARKSKPQEVSK